MKRIAKFSHRKKYLIVIIALLVSVFFIFSCSDDKTGPDDSEENITNERTKVVEEQETEEITQITNNQINFSDDQISIETYEKGDILVSEPFDKAEYGFLRKIDSISQSGEEIVITTSQARLEDAFDELHLRIHDTLRTSDIKSSKPLIEGVKFIKDPKNPYNFEYVIDESFPLNNNVTIEIDGNIIITLGYVFDLDINRTDGLYYLRAGGYSTGDVSIVSSINGEFNYEEEIEIYAQKFLPPVTYVTPTLPPVPIVLVPKVVIVLEIDANGEAAITTSVSADAYFSAGLNYYYGDWSPYKEKNIDFSYTPPTLSSSLNTFVGVGPRFEINLFDIAGPYVKPLGYLELKANPQNNPWWSLYGGFKVNAGVKFDAIGYVLDYEVEDIIDYKYPIDEGLNQPPDPPSNPEPADNATSVSTNTSLNWDCSDPESDPLTYDVYFGISSNPPLVNSGQSATTYNPETLNEETTYYWKIKAHDDHSNSTAGDVWEFTTVVYPLNPPSNPNPADNATLISTNADLSWECSDPNNDPLTYDVYFSTDQNPQLVSEGQSETEYNPEQLEFETTYYWKIIVHDDHSNSVPGPIWQFTTTSGGGTGTVTDIDGNVYQTMVIGDQEWMIENLKVTHYRNGDAIPHVTDNSTWADLSIGAYCYYDNDPSNAETYGNLYNWYAVDDSRNIAPEGWHVPTDDEIMELEMAVGISYHEAHTYGYRGTNEGSKLAGGYDLWYNGDLRNDPEFDTSGFSFLPGGFRYYYNGNFYLMGHNGYFWSSTETNSSNAWYRHLRYYGTTVYRGSINKHYGFSVRCVRD